MLPLALSSNPATASETVTGTVTLDAPAPAGGATVALKSDTTPVATVPGYVNVQPGATSATFPVSIVSTGTATITAEYNGYRQFTVYAVPAGEGAPSSSGPFGENPGPGGVNGGPTTAPTLTATHEMEQVDLSWTAVAGAGVIGYNVLRSNNAGGPFTPLYTGITGTEWNDTTATSGGPYYYVVVAANEVGPGPYSNVALYGPVATPQFWPPAGPVTASQLISIFELDAVDGDLLYDYTRRRDADRADHGLHALHGAIHP